MVVTVTHPVSKLATTETKSRCVKGGNSQPIFSILSEHKNEHSHSGRQTDWHYANNLLWIPCQFFFIVISSVSS